MEFSQLQDEFQEIKARSSKIAGGPPPINMPLFNSKHSITPHPGFKEACFLSEKMKFKNYSSRNVPKEPTTTRSSAAAAASFDLPDDVVFRSLTTFLSQPPSYLRMEDLEEAKNMACQVLSKGPKANLQLISLSHDVLYNIIEIGGSYQADQFLNSLLLTFVSMHYLKVNAPQSSIEDRASRMSHRAFHRRSSNKYLETATAADKQSTDPSLELLKRECHKSLVDLIFKIRMRMIVSLVQGGPRPDIMRKTTTAQNSHGQHLYCRIPRIPLPPRIPQKPAVGGFFTSETANN